MTQAVALAQLGNGPAFSATMSGHQTIASSATFTKVPFSVEELDTNGCYDNVTNYRFTPTTPGYYYITFCMTGSQNGGSTMTQVAHIYKNGASVRNLTTASISGNYTAATVSAILFFNGTTDYVEAYTWATLSSIVYSYSSFSGYLVRGA